MNAERKKAESRICHGATQEAKCEILVKAAERKLRKPCPTSVASMLMGVGHPLKHGKPTNIYTFKKSDLSSSSSYKLVTVLCME